MPNPAVGISERDVLMMLLVELRILNRLTSEANWPNKDELLALRADVQPLYTGFVHNDAIGGYSKNGQVAIQQRNPLPLTVLSIVPEILEGDTPDSGARRRE